MARAREGGERVVPHGTALGRAPLPSDGQAHMHFRLDDDGDVLAARPSPLVEVRPQGRVQRHTVEHIVDACPFVQILDVPVPQMETSIGKKKMLQRDRHSDPGAGYRSARDLPRQSSTAFCGASSSAEGGTVDGKCPPLSLFPRSSSRLRRKFLTFQFLVLVVVEVFKVFIQDLARWSVQWNRALTFQFLVVVPVEVFKVFLPDRAPHSVLWSRTLIFQFPVLVPVVVFPQDRVRSAQWSRSWIFHCLVRVMVEVFLVFTFNRVPLLVVELVMPGCVGVLGSLRRGCMPSWMRSRPTISSSLLSRWISLPRSFRSSNGSPVASARRILHFTLCSLFLSTGPRFSASCTVWTRRIVLQGRA